MQYTLRHHPRSRNIRISIKPGGEVVVSAPKRVSVAMVERFIQQKQDWIDDAVSRARKHVPSPLRIRTSDKDFQLYKLQALHLAIERIKHFNAMYNFSVKHIYIKNQKTRWGSCSKVGNINLSYKIVLLPPHLADYIIVHELCHIGQFNHSQKFWDLVEKTVPEYRMFREELKKY